jgi:hypothetical protein
MSLIIKRRIRNERVDTLQGWIKLWRDEGVEMFKINEYQYRIVREGHALDYYPTSGKYFDNQKNKWGFVSVPKIIDLFFD